LTSPQDRDLLISTAQSLKVELVKNSLNSFTISGSLKFVTEFRQILDEKIMAACLNARHEGQSQGASAEAVSSGSRNASGRDVSGAKTELKALKDRLNRDVLILMLCFGETHGCVVNPISGEVWVGDNGKKDMFYYTYDTYSKLKLKTEVVKVPMHIAIACLKSEMELLKKKHNQCGFFVFEDAREIKIVSPSSRQFESFMSFLKTYLDVLSFTLPCGRVLSLLRRNIVNEKVDVIVNAANGDLDHAGGVAKAINDASHGEIQRFSKQYMKSRQWRTLQAGEVAVTRAGQYLLCNDVIHAVGPYGSQRNCRNIMNTLVHAILNAGEKLGAKSLAMPAISTGIFNVSKDVVANCFFSEIPAHRFRQRPPVLSDIRVVIIDQPTFDCFHQHFTRMLLSKITTAGSLDQSSGRTSGAAPHPNAQDSSSRNEEERSATGHGSGQYKSHNRSKSPVNDRKDNRSRAKHYDRSNSGEGKNAQKDIGSSNVEESENREDKVKHVDNDKLTDSGCDGAGDTHVGDADKKNSTSDCTASTTSGDCGDQNPSCQEGDGGDGKETFHDARSESSCGRDKVASIEGQGGHPTNSKDEMQTSPVVDHSPDQSSEEPSESKTTSYPSPSTTDDPPTQSLSTTTMAGTPGPFPSSGGGQAVLGSNDATHSIQENFGEEPYHIIIH